MRIHEYPHQFSGGMRQRVMIAMALACKPRVLIADEPTTALDVTIQAQILQLLKELQEEEGMSVLFITHDMGVVAEIADRSVVMYDGRIVEIGDTVDIFERPAKGYTQALLSSVPKLGSMAGIDQPMRFPSIDRATGRMQPPAPLEHTARFAERPLLEVKGLTKRFEIRKGLFSTVTGRVHAIENVSFNLHKGETLALVGESGCGKSTTGRAILRLTSLDSGSILMGDQDISRMEGDALRAARKRMQIIFQDPFASLNPRIPVGLAVCEPLLAHGMITRGKIRDRAATLLESVGLDGAMATRYPHEFSGGQRQRICIARAMALEPDLIIADESVSALDVSVKAQVINLMLDLQEKMGLSYLFISHDIAVVERMAHRIAVMFLGEIVEIGPRAAVLGSPQHPYTKKLISAVPSPDPARRHGRRATSDDELISPIRPADYVVPSRSYREVSPGHLVQE
jgi:peptide/nickel transport system ATP-binding protein